MPAPVQMLTPTANANTITGTFTAGNTLIACVTVKGFGVGLTSLTDNHSGTFNLVDKTTIASVVVGSGAYLLNITGGSTTVTINTTGTGPLFAWVLYEYAAADAISFDLNAKATSAGGTNPASGTTGTTSFATETIVGWLTETSVTASTAGTGYGDLTANINVANTISATLEDKFVTSTGTQQATFNNSGSVAYVCGVMTFKGTAITTTRKNHLAFMGVAVLMTLRSLSAVVQFVTARRYKLAWNEFS